MLRFIVETGFCLFIVGAWGHLWYERSWQSPLVPVDAVLKVQTVSFKFLQSNQTRYDRKHFINFETTGGQQHSVELPRHLPCCLLVKRLNELRSGSQVQIAWSAEHGIGYLNIEDGEEEISPTKMWAKYQDDWGMRWLMIIGLLCCAGWVGHIWKKHSLTVRPGT